MNKPHPTDRSWVDELQDEIWMLGVEHESWTIPEVENRMEKTKATINQKINEEFEELLKSLPEDIPDTDAEDLRKGTYRNGQHFFRKGHNIALLEIRSLIKNHIKEEK